MHQLVLRFAFLFNSIKFSYAQGEQEEYKGEQSAAFNDDAGSTIQSKMAHTGKATSQDSCTISEFTAT